MRSLPVHRNLQTISPSTRSSRNVWLSAFVLQPIVLLTFRFRARAHSVPSPYFLLSQKESSASYLAAKRQDLADKESSEATFISQFLPKGLTTEEVRERELDFLLLLLSSDSSPPSLDSTQITATLTRLSKELSLPEGDMKSMGSFRSSLPPILSVNQRRVELPTYTPSLLRSS